MYYYYDINLCVTNVALGGTSFTEFCIQFNLNHMKKNMGSVDKAVRILAAVIIAILYFLNFISGTLAIVLLAVAAIFIVTSFMSFCPLYYPFGISTRKKE